MVKTKQHSVRFDVDERNSFLKQFSGKRAKDKLKKKKTMKKQKKEKKARAEMQLKTKEKKMRSYEDIDKVNDLKVIVTTTFEE